jgi:ribosomal protein S27AE
MRQRDLVNYVDASLNSRCIIVDKGDAMRFLNISGPGVAKDEDFCPNCHLLMDERDDYKVCPICKYDTRQGARQHRIQRRRR